MKTQAEGRSSESGTGFRRPRLLRVRAGIPAAAVVGLVVVTGCAGPQAATDDTVELVLPDTGGAMASCLPFTVDYLAEMTTALAGTATTVTEDQVRLDVDRWYAGGNASSVVLDIPDGAHAALIGEIDFREGGRYLITAAEGTVNMCGYSGEATPEMEAAFEVAF